MEASQAGTDSQKKRKRRRSPNYPGINLEDAVERARVLYQHEGLHAAPREVLAAHLGLSPKSGTGQVVLGAIAGFGLLEKHEDGLRLTSLARDIIEDERPDSLDRAMALQRAARIPKVHEQILNKYNGQVPSDENLNYYLRREMGFSERGASEFIAQFRATLAFARLAESGRLSNEETEEEPPETSQGDGHQTLEAPAGVRPSRPSIVARPGMNQDSFTLDEGQVILQWPSRISRENYDDLKDWLELMTRRIERAVRSAEKPADPESGSE